MKMRLKSWAGTFSTPITVRALAAIAATLFSIAAGQAAAQAEDSGIVHVDINADVLHTVGGQSRFDRRRFITLHSTHTDPDWQGGNAQSLGAENASDDLMADFLEGNDVYFGRDTGAMAWHLSQLPEDPMRPGYVDESAVEWRGDNFRWQYENDSTTHALRVRQHAHRDGNLNIAAQLHPYWPDGTATGQGWAFSTVDSAQEPLGTATGHFMSQYLKWFFADGKASNYGQPKPRWVEVINEPLYGLITDAVIPEQPSRIFEFHNTVATEIRKVHADVLIGGYTAAFPDFEKDNFERWETRDRLFVNIAGDQMDFWSIHLYDFPEFIGDPVHQQQYRKGSNLEATFDMLDHYSLLALGELKPYVISEYGAQVHASLNDPWTPLRDWKILKSVNAMLMAFLERPDRIALAVPFIVVKAEWGRRATDVPYAHRLMRQAREAPGADGDEWVYSDLAKFYQLWSGINGQRIDSYSSDLDIRVDAYVDGSDLYLVANNLEFEPATLEFHLSGLDSKRNGVTGVSVRHLHRVGDAAIIDTNSWTKLPRTFELDAEATAIFHIQLANKHQTRHKSGERTYFATTFKQPVSANQPLVFEVNDVVPGKYGEAFIRLGLGRDHGLSLQPEVRINDQPVVVPTDLRGGDQILGGSGRPSFFGVLEIPVPYESLQRNNRIEVTFPDSGGFVSSLAIQSFRFSRAIDRH